MPKKEKLPEGIENPGFQNDELQTSNTDQAAIKEETSRDIWSNPVEFLLSCIAMSVGLGNVWRFPFTAYENGGGAFLIPYLVVLIFIGKPLYYLELCMGQFSSSGCIKMWDIIPAFRGVGYGQMIATTTVVTYYVSLMALTMFYFFASFATTLPWATCPVNVTNCIDVTSYNDSNISIATSMSSAEIYFENEVLHIHPNGLDDGIFAPDWRLTLCLLGSWTVLYLVLARGVKSSGKSAYFTALFPYVVLFVLLGRGVTLPGSMKGIKYFVTPQWEKLLEPRVWYNAVGQSFFSLSVGFGAIMMFSSHNNFRHNVYRDATIISVIDTLTSLLAGCTIFAILGHLADQMGIDDIELVIKGGGSGLAFVSYPDVLARFTYAPQLFAVLFFLMLFTLGVGSASGLAGAIITVVCDSFPNAKRYVVTAVICCVGFLLGLFYVTPQGQYILTLVDFYGGTFVIYVLAFLEVIAVMWVYGYANFTRDIKFMLGIDTGIYWAFCWKFFIPGLLFVVFIYNLVDLQPLESAGYVFGVGANSFGLIIVVVAVGMVPMCFFMTIYRKKTKSKFWYEAAKESLQPTDGWCPKDPILRQEYRKLLRYDESNEVYDNPMAMDYRSAEIQTNQLPNIDLKSYKTDS